MGLTGDEYMTLLLERQADYERAHPDTSGRPWVRPLLEWFIRPGDEDLFAPPAEPPQSKRETKPRTYRSAASLREERDRLAAQAEPLTRPILSDRAAAGGVALGARRTARVQKSEDRKLQKYAALTRRIERLNQRIRLAEAREATRA